MKKAEKKWERKGQKRRKNKMWETERSVGCMTAEWFVTLLKRRCWLCLLIYWDVLVPYEHAGHVRTSQKSHCPLGFPSVRALQLPCTLSGRSHCTDNIYII